MLSDQQTSWWVWRSPTIRQQTVSSNYTFFIQVSKYHPDHYRIFDAGNDLDITAAFAASINIDVKHAFQALCPSHCSMTLGRGLILFVICCLGFSAFAPFRGCHHCPIAAIGCKYAMETSEVDSGFGNQSNQPGDKIQR